MTYNFELTNGEGIFVKHFSADEFGKFSLSDFNLTEMIYIYF